MSSKTLLTVVLRGALCFTGTGFAGAAMISVNPSKDNTLYQYVPADGDLSNGAGFQFFAQLPQI
jgi:hypothetical protein